VYDVLVYNVMTSVFTHMVYDVLVYNAMTSVCYPCGERCSRM